MTNSPISRIWGMEADKDAWLRRIGRRARRWSPDPLLEVDGHRVRAALVQAAGERCDWLYDPAFSRLTADTNELRGDLALVMRLAAFSGEPLGAVTVPHQELTTFEPSELPA